MDTVSPTERTPGTEQLAQLMTRAPRPVAEYLLATVKHYRDEFRRIESDGEANSESVADSIHRLVDEQVAELLATDPNAHRVACRRGCSHCCYLHVRVDRHEAALLLYGASELGVDVDWSRIERQRGRDFDAWRALPHADKACAFLNDAGECRVYDWRPTACRKYQVLDDPDLCDTAAHPGAEVGMLVSGLAEAIASAALAAFPGSGSMADMLLRAKGERT